MLAGIMLLSVAACQEREKILTGEREEIRSDEESASISTAPEQNTSRSIRLPGQKANRDWPQSFGTPAYRTAHPALRSVPQPVWSTSIGQGDERRARITAAPVVGGGLIYTLDSGATVSAITPDGAVAWRSELLPPSDDAGEATGGGLAYDNGTLYVSSGFGLLTALDAKTGGQRWQQVLDATGSGSPLVAGGLVYLVAGDDTGWAVEAKTGRIAWQVEATPSISNVLGAPAPALAGDLVVFAFGSGDIVATFRRGGLQRWSASVAGQRSGVARSRIGDITGSPVVVGRAVYAGNHSGRTVAMSAETGDRLWTAAEGALGPVWPAGGSLFLVSDTGHLVRINAADGSVIWAVNLPGNVKDKPGKRGPSYAQYGPVLAGGRVIVPSGDGVIRFFAPEDGAQTGSVPIDGGAATAPVVAGQTLYVVSTKGVLHAYR